MNATSARRNLHVVLAAGGTGGHTFPAQALAEVLAERGHRPIFITDHRGRISGGAIPSRDMHRLSVLSPAGGWVARGRCAVSMVRAYGEARGLLRAEAPDAVVGFGGYPSAPTVLAATQLGIPLVLHEQNAKLGKTNRWMARRAECVATSFAEAAKDSAPLSARVKLTGNPVRRAVVLVREEAYAAPAGNGPFNILVTGGSQGARALAEKVPAALALLPDALRQRLHLTLQCPRTSMAEARAALEKAHVSADVAEFFDDIPRRLQGAHLVICRSGASSVCELAVAGRPGIFVPYPYHKDQQQLFNARALTGNGGGWLMEEKDLTAEALAELVGDLAENPARLAAAARAAFERGVPDAAARLADLVQDITGYRPTNGHPLEEAAQ